MNRPLLFLAVLFWDLFNGTLKKSQFSDVTVEMKEFLNHLVSGVCYIPILGSIFGCWVITSHPPKKNRKTGCFLWLFSQACGSQNTGGRKVSRGWHGKQILLSKMLNDMLRRFLRREERHKKRFMVFQVESCSECKQTIPQKSNMSIPKMAML